MVTASISSPGGLSPLTKSILPSTATQLMANSHRLTIKASWMDSMARWFITTIKGNGFISQWRNNPEILLLGTCTDIGFFHFRRLELPALLVVDRDHAFADVVHPAIERKIAVAQAIRHGGMRAQVPQLRHHILFCPG